MFPQVSDVLGNVSKMEESLRKLKKVRERQEAKVEARTGLRWTSCTLTLHLVSPAGVNVWHFRVIKPHQTF